MAIANYLYLSAILFTIGAIGVVVRRNAIVVFNSFIYCQYLKLSLQ